MAFDVGWAHDPNMPWSSLTQAALFTLETTNGAGLDTHLVNTTNIASWVSAAHSHGVQAFIAIGGSDDQNWQNACNDTNRAGFVRNLVNYATSHRFVGIDLDIEDHAWSKDGSPSPPMTACIEAVAAAAHAAGLIVSADVVTNWQGAWFAPSQSHVDQFNLMTYGDSLSPLAADVARTVAQGLRQSKFTVGIDSINGPPPSHCGAYGSYAASNGLKGAFVFATSNDQTSSRRTHVCLRQLHSAHATH